MKSLAARIVFAAKDFADAREISDELGFSTVKVKTLSKPLFDLSDARGRKSRSQNVSEQRRSLLLPQEVKELGQEHAIIFYEGLRPIRCRKLRYFEDARFRARLMPPPEIPARTFVAPPVSDAPDLKAAPVPAPGSADTREATIEDIERIEELKLEDFATDFSQVKLPDAERLTEEDLGVAVQSFLSSLRER
jgi:type IV secretion system protein VirD4